MDFLATPANPSFPVEKTPYVCRERWDGLPFLTWAERKSLLGIVPQLHRAAGQSLAVPYTEQYRPIPQAERSEIYQTWLFFGLMAEAWSLNELPDGSRLVPPDQAAEELGGFYERFVVVGEDGERWVDVTSWDRVKMGTLFLERLPAGPERRSSRLSHISTCLHFVSEMINRFDHKVDEVIYLSIAGLCEIISVGLVGLTAGESSSEQKVPSYSSAYSAHFLAPGSTTGGKMLEHGWCPSDIWRARKMYSGAITQYFISRIDRSLPRRDHGTCRDDMCVLFQIDPQTYKLAHADEGCACVEFNVDIGEVLRILEATESFPVLRFEDAGGELTLVVEEQKDGIPYVALSHVWADGLGNPRDNSIQHCQIGRLYRLLQHLKSISPLRKGELTQHPYRLWIDTLCCPAFQGPHKNLAIQRITDVYTGARHVLILDASLSSYPAGDVDPAETALRIFSSSAWMRRLWTLQEGMLAKSLYFQFSDTAVEPFSLFYDLYRRVTDDVRMLAIHGDVGQEIARLSMRYTCVAGAQPDCPCFVCSMPEHDEQRAVLSNLLYRWPINNPHPSKKLLRLDQVAKSLQFRSVSVPSDEPICLATLLSLDVKQILALSSHQDRMKKFWLLLNETYGAVPAKLVITTERPFEDPGWRWANQSMMQLKLINQLLSRQAPVFDLSLTFIEPGYITPRGLKVKFPGGRLVARPYAANLPHHPWASIFRPPTPLIHIKNSTTGEWFQLLDYDCTGTRTDEEQERWEAEHNDPFCGIMHDNNHGLILNSVQFNSFIRSEIEAQICVLVKLCPGEFPQEEGLVVERNRSVMMRTYPISGQVFCSTMSEIASEMAEHPISTRLVDLQEDRGEEFVKAVDVFRKRVHELMDAAWKDREGFRAAALETVGASEGADLESVRMKLRRCLLQFSHVMEFEELPSDQVWTVG